MAFIPEAIERYKVLINEIKQEYKELLKIKPQSIAERKILNNDREIIAYQLYVYKETLEDLIRRKKAIEGVKSEK